MGEKLIITRRDGFVISSVLEEDKLVQIHAEKILAESFLGNIYLGKVKNIVKNINAAFVEIKDGVICYLPLGENNSPIFANAKKNNKINVGDTIMVQISKEDVKTKAPYGTCNLNLSGKYVVLTHGKPKMGVSSKITEIEERERLKRLLAEYENEDYGFIIRTNGAGESKERLQGEMNRLKALYENILTFGIHKAKFSCLYQAPPAYICSIRDELSSQLNEIITDDKDFFGEIQDYLNCYQPEDLEKIRFFEDNSIGLNEIYSIEARLNKALLKQVWLKSGGSIVIEPTEALTVIDVNTGKAIRGNKNVQETFQKVNLEAASEIARQIRLRNLSGIIIVDFIGLDSPEANQELLKNFEKALSKDPVKTTLVDMTPLGLVEITRKKVRKPLHEQLKNSII